MATTTPATLGTGAPNAVFARSGGGPAYKGGAANTNLHFQSLSPAGGSLPHNNMMPSLTLLYVIAMQGVFPPRS
jgi:microcystin-dependent protein